MKILISGKNKKEKETVITCNCSCKFSFTKSEARLHTAPNDVAYIVNCPECNHENWVAPSLVV